MSMILGDAVTVGSGGSSVNVLEWATSISGLYQNATNMPKNLTLICPNAKTLSSLGQYAKSITGNPPAADTTITIEFTDKVTNMSSCLQAIDSAYKLLRLRGSTKNVTNFNYFAYLANIAMTDDSDPIDMTSATGIATANMMGYAYSLADLRFKPNTRSLSYTGDEGINSARTPTTAGAISYANCLKDAAGVAKSIPCSGWITTLDAVVGRVEQRTDDTGTYDFFVADATGSYTLTDFITSVKGWTIV